MPWSVIQNVKKEFKPDYLFQTFTKDEWNEYPFQSEENLKWFKDAKYGLFFHVGISSVGKVDIGWSRQTHKLPDPGEGHIPDQIYDGWVTELKMEEFNAKEWVKLAWQGGMKYIVIITKHHDGFHMWDTQYSNHKITHTPFQRDYIKELTDACHEEQMPVGLYYSQRDWYHPDYEPIDTTVAEACSEVPFYRIKANEKFKIGRKHKTYIEYMHHTVKELMSNYGKIDILWWDACWYGGMFLEEMWEGAKLEKEVRQLQPHIIINNRNSLPGDFDTPEGQVGFFQNHRPWETCMPLGNEWAWTGNQLKSYEEVIRQLVGCACGDGNYLLSIGAMPNGQIAAQERESILKIGEWLSLYGESIYNTRGGPWLPSNWGGSVCKKNKIYIHITKSFKEILLPEIDNKITHARSLTGEKFTWDLVGHQIRITLDDVNEDRVDCIIELTMQKDVVVAIKDIFEGGI